MIGLTSLEVYNSIYNIKPGNNKFEIYTDTLNEFSFGELKAELEEIVNVSNISHEHLRDKIIGPHIILAYKKLESEKKQTDGYYILLLGYARIQFRDF